MSKKALLAGVVGAAMMVTFCACAQQGGSNIGC